MKLLKVLKLIKEASSLERDIQSTYYKEPRRNQFASRAKWKKARKVWIEGRKKIKVKLKKIEDTEV